MKFILGLKIGMSQVFGEAGQVVPVTLVEAGPCQVLEVKTEEKDKYQAVQVGFIKKTKKVKKTEKGKEFKYKREFQNSDKLKVGDEIRVSIFETKDKVSVSGVSKGKGFQGAVKRWGFAGRDATHGTKHEERTLGSIGATGPQRVFKGRKMPGRMGTQRVTLKNLEVLRVDKDNNLLAIKGAIPGRKGTLLEIRGSGDEVKTSSSPSSN